MMMTKLQQAKDLIDNEKYESGIIVLNDLHDLSLKDERFKLLLLAYALYNTEKYNQAIDIADELLQKNSNNEYASQIKYFSYCGLEDYDNALNEVIRFLSHNAANLYKVTLEELALDIKNGNISEESTVNKLKELALKNNVTM
ncbi:MAG TPA: hypothetical protein DIT10_10090 [Chryseobacterium sp.]|nr:hypothetical protein [Chryseobacterium sp.]